MANKSDVEVLKQWASEPMSAEDTDVFGRLVTGDELTVDEQSEALKNDDVRAVVKKAGEQAVAQALDNADRDEREALKDHWTQSNGA